MFYNIKFVLLIKKIHRLTQHVKNNFTKHQVNLSNPLLFFFSSHTEHLPPPTTFLTARKSLDDVQVPFYP